MYDGIAFGDDVFQLSVYSPSHGSHEQRPSFKDSTSHEFKSTHVGAWFGPSWSTHWVKVKLRVPDSLQKKEHLEFHWDAHNEGLIWTEDGEPLQGLTGNGERVEWVLEGKYRDGDYHTFYIEMACNGMFGNAPGGDSIQPPDPNKYFQLTKCEVVAVNLEARALYIDFWILGDAAREFPEDSWEEHKALQLANKIMDCWIAGDGGRECISDCREIAREYLGDTSSSEVYDTNEEALVYAVGNCHIDTCWLWPWAETKRKVARSWANQCNLLDRYPEHRFACSQAQQYQWLEQLYPKLFDRVKDHVKKGNFQPIGGSWVEHDTNMPSGESLVRQFLYGQRYFESRFGERSKTFWLPDTFGYSSQLPQICRLAGMNRFFTQKISWNNINNFPHSTFNWVALDGSQVLCHMAPDNTYTANADFGDVSRSLTQNKSMDQDPRGILAFGKGDGGGGPTWEMIEKLRRCRGMSDTTGRLPRVQMGDSVDDFFSRLEQKAASGTKFVTWYGELYLELHRGTYTTQANNKWNNRKTEILLHDVEFFATMATLKDDSYKYPKKELDGMWEGILLCQFHDCLPGSALEMCYRDSDELYAKVFKTGEKLMKEALSVLIPRQGRLTGSGSEMIALNTLPWSRKELVQIDSTYAIASGEEGICSIEYVKPESSSCPKASISEIKKGVYELRNKFYIVVVEDGCITSLVDIANDRELVAKGSKANQFVIFDDKPLYWQAWDVEVYHLESRKELFATSSQITEEGPLKVSLTTETKISDQSWIKTTISLAAGITSGPSYIEMASEVEWRENKQFLKVEFPVDIMNTEASYETQFGIIRRPTHYNTSWDMAKFEVCSHKWADLSENGYGVSILNDSKYGFATAGNVMRLSLLRAPKAPDAHADMGIVLAPINDELLADRPLLGRHHIRYAIFPHAGPLDHRTVRTARNFNQPLKVQGVTRASLSEHMASTSSLFSSITLEGNPALILDTIKRGEDDEDVSRGELPKRSGRSIIVRIYESLGGKARGTLYLDNVLGVKAVYQTNLLEDDEDSCTLLGDLDEEPWRGSFRRSGPSALQAQKVMIELRAFEVATFRLQL